MGEILNKLFTPVYERVKNPLYSTFAISWCISNWKIIYVTIFLSNENVSVPFKGLTYSFGNKIEAIQFLLSKYEYSLVVPICVTIIHFSILNKLINHVAEIAEKSKQDRLAKKLDITKNSIVSGERYIKLIEDYNKERQRLADIDEELNKKQIALADALNLISEKSDRANEAEVKLQVFRDRLEGIKKVFEGSTSLITSDQSTKFIGSPTYKELSKHAPVFVFDMDSPDHKISDYWRSPYNKHIDIFKYSNFIAHARHVTLKEARDGGQYNFLQEFSLNFDPLQELKSATLHFIVDDSIEIFINNGKVYYLSDKDSCQYRYISVLNSLVVGQNLIQFNVRNSPMNIKDSEADRNPYGIIFTLELELG